MSSLTNEQKQLLFDHCIGLASEKDSARAKTLIASNKEAAEIHSKIKTALAPLDTIEPEPCPDVLVERTIQRLNQAKTANSSRLQLQQLLAIEQSRQVSTRVGFWSNWGEMITAAAVILFFSGVLIGPLNFFRQESWKQRCQAQMGSIFQGISSYTADHDGRLPAVASQPGLPWWKVGDKSEKYCPPTRNNWLLVKLGYVKPGDFVCPGRSQGRTLQYDTTKAKKYNDFPAGRYITYSSPIRRPKSQKDCMLGQDPLMADLSPVFEELLRDCSCDFMLHLNDTLRTINSSSHRRRGQNILRGGGSVIFIRVRYIGIAKDDIYTLQDTVVYQGCEVPSCEADIFLAP